MSATCSTLASRLINCCDAVATSATCRLKSQRNTCCDHVTVRTSRSAAANIEPWYSLSAFGPYVSQQIAWISQDSVMSEPVTTSWAIVETYKFLSSNQPASERHQSSMAGHLTSSSRGATAHRIRQSVALTPDKRANRQPAVVWWCREGRWAAGRGLQWNIICGIQNAQKQVFTYEVHGTN